MFKIGWIGTGKMGSRLSMRLIKAGYDVSVFDIDRTNVRPVVQAGAKFIDNAADLAGDVDILFTMIPNSKILIDIVTGEKGINEKLRAGTIVVDMSTIDPEGSAVVNMEIEKRKGIFLRTPVTGSISNAENGDLGIMCSGEKEAYDKVLPIFRQLSNRQYYLGKSEEARHMKLAVNIMIGDIAQILAEALVFGESVGLDWDTMVEVFANSAAAAPIIKFKADALKKRDFTPMGTVDIVIKDLAMALDIAEEKSLKLPVTSISQRYFESMHASGRGEMDYAAVLLLNEELNGIKHNPSR